MSEFSTFTMATLDPITQNFVTSVAKEKPLYEQSYVDARQQLETLQKHEASLDIKEFKIEVPFDGRRVPAVIFRPHLAKHDMPVLFYTHGGGWILGR